MKKLYLVFLLCFFVMSCVGGLARPYQRKATFNESEYLPFTKPGKAVITGQAFTTTRSGEVRYAAGRSVYLYPATTYGMEYFDIQVVQGLFMSAPDTRFLQFEKKTVSDATGNFEFKNLPVGKYYVVTNTSWCAGRNPQYVIFGAQVEAKDDEVTKAILPVVRVPIFYADSISCY